MRKESTRKSDSVGRQGMQKVDDVQNNAHEPEEITAKDHRGKAVNTHKSTHDLRLKRFSTKIFHNL